MSGGGGFRDRGFASRGHYRQGADGSGGPNSHQSRNDSRTGNSISRTRGTGGTRMGYRGVGARSNLRSDASNSQSGGSNFRSSRGHPAHRSQMSDNNWPANNWSNNNAGNNWSNNNGGNNWSDNNGGNNWSNNVWADNNGGNNWSENNGGNNWADNNGGNNWSDNNGGNGWSDNNGGNNWSDNNSSRNWAPQGMVPMQGMGPSQGLGPLQGLGPPQNMGPPQGIGPPGGFSPWRSGCAPSRFNSPSPFFHPPGQNAFVPYRFLPPTGNNFPGPNHHEYTTMEASPNSQSQSDVKTPTNAKKSSSTQQKIDNPPKLQKPQKQTLHPGSKEERAQKITEAADKLKRTLSTIRKKSESLLDEKEDDNVDFSSRDYDHEPRIEHRGIPELKHDPPELNLTLNDLRDIGRVDHDHAAKSSKISKDATNDDHEVTILEHDPVRQCPKPTIDISQDDDDNEHEIGDVSQRDETIDGGEDETEKRNIFESDDSLSRDLPRSENIQRYRHDNADIEKSRERTNEEEKFAEEEITIDRAEQNRRNDDDDTQNQRSKAENVEISRDETLSRKRQAMTDNCTEKKDNDGLTKAKVTLDGEKTDARDSNEINAESSIAENPSGLWRSTATSETGNTKVCAEIEGASSDTEMRSNFGTKEGEEAANRDNKTEGESETSEKISKLGNVDVISDENAETKADETGEKIDCSEESDISMDARAKFDEKAEEKNERIDKIVSIDKADSTESISNKEETIVVESSKKTSGVEERETASVDFRDKSVISETRRNIITEKNENDKNSEPIDNSEESQQARKDTSEKSRHDETKEESRSNHNRAEAKIASSASIKARSSSASTINDSEESKCRKNLEKKASGNSTRNNERCADHRESQPDTTKTETKKSKLRDQEPETPPNDAKFPEKRKLPRRTTHENEAKSHKTIIKDSNRETPKSSDENIHSNECKSSLDSSLSNSSDKRGSTDAFPSTTRFNLNKSTKRNKDETPSVKFDPKQPPPNIIGGYEAPGYLPPAFDSRLSSHERSVILTSSMPINQDFPMTQGYPPCTMANLVANVPSINYVVPTAVPPPIIANSLEPNGAIPSMCMADPYAALLPLPNIPLVPPLILSNDILLQPPLPAELPPPPPPPTKSTINMEDGLEDMQEAMEFAKQFMDMEEVDEKHEDRDILDDNLSDEFDIFHMPTFPDLPPIELPPTPSIEAKDSERSDRNDRRSRCTSDGKRASTRSTKNENVAYGPDPKPQEYRDNCDEAEITSDDTKLNNDEHLRPKVVFNLNSKSKKIGKHDEWHSQSERIDVHGRYSPVFSTANTISNAEATKNRYKNKVLSSSQSSTSTKDKSATIFNGKIDSTPMNYSQIVKKMEITRSPTPPRRDKYEKPVKIDEESLRKLETDKIDTLRQRANKESLVGRSKNVQTPESAWKNRVIGRFLKMSKNDICNMLNNASLRKFDIAMKHLVKERRSSMSLEMRNNEEDRMRDNAETTYNREEFMDQLSAMLDPSATVDICNLPTQFIHHLSEVLQLDAIPELETQRNKTDLVANVSSSPRTNFVSREDARVSNDIVAGRENDVSRGRKRERDKHANSAVEGNASATKSSAIPAAEKRKVCSRTSDKTVVERIKCDTENVEDNTSNRAVIGPRPIRRRRLRVAAIPDDRAIKMNDDKAGGNDQGSLNLADLDDIFSAGIARVKKKLVGVPATKAIRKEGASERNAGTSKDCNIDRVERAVVELDEIFSAGIARAKLASKKAAEAAKVAEANDADVDDDERTWNQSEPRANAFDSNRSKAKSSASLRNSCKTDNWNCRKIREEPAAFRNLTKEEWEARYGETSYSSYQREYRAMEALRARRTSHSPSGLKQDHHQTEANDTSCVRSRLFENNMGIPSFHECWSGSDEQQGRFRNNTEIMNYQMANDRTSDDSSSTSTTSSSSDGDNDDEAPPSVTKLLKVIKEREKIAKQKSLNEEIRDEVTAEIERKRREKDRVRKKHKTRTKKSSGHHRRKRDKKDKSRDRKKRERKRRKRKSRRSNDNSRENSGNEDADEEYTSSTSRGLHHRRLLTEDEIKKEIVIKEEEPAVGRKFIGDKKGGKISTNVAKIIDDSRPASTASSSSIPTTITTTASVAIQTTIVQQPKTKAQLKQMPADIAEKSINVAPVNKQTAKNQGAKVNDNSTENITKNITPARTSEISNVFKEPEKSVDSETLVVPPIISEQPASVISNDDVTSKVNSKKLDIKAYKERTRQRQQKENEKIRFLTDNPSSLTQDLLNISLSRKQENDDADADDEATEKNVRVRSTDSRSKEIEKTSTTNVATDPIDSTIVQPASTSMSTAKATLSKSAVEAKKISPIKAPRKKIVRRPAGTNAISTCIEPKLTSEDAPDEVSKFAHIKSEGRKEMKLREKLKRERSKIIVDSVNAPSPKPTKLKRRKIPVAPSANETISSAVEMKKTQVPMTDDIDVAEKAPEDSNDLAKSTTETAIDNTINPDTINTSARIVNFRTVEETNHFNVPRIIDAGNAISDNLDNAETSSVTEGETVVSKNLADSETSNTTEDEKVVSESLDNCETSNETKDEKVATENLDNAETSNDTANEKMVSENLETAEKLSETKDDENVSESLVNAEIPNEAKNGKLVFENLDSAGNVSETKDEKMVSESSVNAETSNETEDEKLASENLDQAQTSNETEDEKIESENLNAEKLNDTKDEKIASDDLETAETSNEEKDEKMVSENLDSVEATSEKEHLEAKLNLDDPKVHNIELTLEESKNPETINIPELSIAPKVPNRSAERPFSSEELAEIVAEDLPSTRKKVVEKVKIVETESELISMELPMEDLPVWSLDVPPITSDAPETLEYSSDGGSFKGFNEETILRRDRVLTEAEITEDSELETFESIPLKFVGDDADNTEENMDIDELTSTDIVDNLDEQLPYDNNEFPETRDEIESSLPDPLGHTIFSVGNGMVEDVPMSLESMEKLSNEVKARDENLESQVKAPITPTLDNSSSIDDFIIDNVRSRETVPSPILDNELAFDDAEAPETLVSSTIIETNVASETKNIEKLRDNGTEVGESSLKLLTNKSEGETLTPIAEHCVAVTETLQRETSFVTLEKDICSVVESSATSKVNEIENSSDSQINSRTKSSTMEKAREEDSAEIDEATLDTENSERISSTRTDENATRKENETLIIRREKFDPEVEQVPAASREKPETEAEKKDSHNSRTRDHGHGRSKKKSSRHHNHGSRASKRTTLTEKMVDEAITANVVKLVAKPNSRDTVMARMIEIDVEIHKLMNEKMTLYKMLESGDFTGHESHDSSAADKTIVETKISAENDETTEIASKNLLASRLARNLATPTPTSMPETATATRTSTKISEEAAKKPETKKLHLEVEEKQKRRKKSPHRETKNRSKERDVVVEQRDEVKYQGARCNATRIIAGDESSRRETPSRCSREKSTSSTDHDDAEEKARKMRIKSPIRRSSKSRSVHSSKENLVELPRDSTDRAEKSSKIDDRSKQRDKTKKKSKHEAKKPEETAAKSKTHEDKLAGASSDVRKAVKTGDIYSDESTLDSQIQTATSKSSEDRGKRDKIEAQTGLALLDKSFKRDVAHHRKDKSLEKRRSKKRDIRRGGRDPTVLTANEAQAGLINLLSRKKLQKKSASSIMRAKSKSFVSTIEDPVKVWKHVSTVIDAVAKNRVDELYTEETPESPSVLEASAIDEQPEANRFEIQRDKEETSTRENQAASETLDESTSKGYYSKLHDKSETVKTADFKGFLLTEASDTVETILQEKPHMKPSNLEDIENPRVSPKPGQTQSFDVCPKTPDIDNDHENVIKTDRLIDQDDDTSDEEITSDKESFDFTRRVKSTKEREKDEEMEIRVPAQERSALAEKPKPWRIDFTEKPIETKVAKSTNHFDTGARTNEETPSREEKTVDEMNEERRKMNKTPYDDDEEIPRSRSRNSRRTKQREKSRGDIGKDVASQKKENHGASSKHENVDENRRIDDNKSSRRPRSAANRKQREKSDKSHRQSSRKSEDRGSKSSRSRKREHDRSNSRGLSPHDDEPLKKRSFHRHRSSSPPINSSAFDDRSKKGQGKKRKRRAEMSLEEMTSCKVELIDCKYTYLSPTMHPRILKKLGISRINRHAAPKIRVENRSPPLLTRNATPSPPILSKIDIAEPPINEDDHQLEKIEIPMAQEEINVPKIAEDENEEVKEVNENSIRSPADCLIVKENVDDDDDEEEDDEDDDNIQIVKAVDENLASVEQGHEDNDETVKDIARRSFDETDNNKNSATETEMITVEEDDENMEEYEVIDEVTDENEDTDENERSKNDTENEDDKIAVPANTEEQPVENEENFVSEENDNETEPRRTRYTVHKGPILDIKVLDDSFLAASEDGAIYRYSQTSNGILNIYKGHDAAVTCINVLEMPGKRWNLYSGSLDGTFRSYDITTGVQDRPANVGSPVQCMDQGWGIIFIGTKSGHISRYNIKSGSLKGDRLEFSDKSVLALKASAEGPRRVLIVASRNQPITIRDANTGLFLRTICGYKNHTVYSLMRDRNLVYCGTSSTSIPVYDFTNGEQITQYNAGVGIVCMRLYRQILFAGCYDGNIYVFDTKESKLICSIPGPGNMLLSMEVINDEIIAGSKNRQLHLWRMPKQVRALLAERT